MTDAIESSGSAGARSDAKRRGDSIDRMIARHGPDAVCAALAPLLTPERIARIDAVLAARLASVVAIVEDTYDPHNAAAAVRTSEALGLCELHAVELHAAFSFARPRGERNRPKLGSRGVTRGAHKWIELVRWPRAHDAVAALHDRGFAVYAALPPPATASIEDLDVSRPVAIAFGNERDGLSAEAIAACDGAVSVPMFGFSESYNLSVTVALAMSRVAARRRAALGALGDLPAERRAQLRARWFALKVRAAVGVLERALGER
jgi:tRNA (guanosine-2'-O-)-methyltransferase